LLDGVSVLRLVTALGIRPAAPRISPATARSPQGTNGTTRRRGDAAPPNRGSTATPPASPITGDWAVIKMRSLAKRLPAAESPPGPPACSEGLGEAADPDQQHADSPAVLQPTESHKSFRGNEAAGKQPPSAEKYVYACERAEAPRAQHRAFDVSPGSCRCQNS